MHDIGLFRPQHLSQFERPQRTITHQTNRNPDRLEVRNQVVLRLDQTQHPVIERVPITRPNLIHDQALGAPGPQPLHHMNHTNSGIRTVVRTVSDHTGETTHVKCPRWLTMQAIRPT